MATPDDQSVMLPLLQWLADGKEHTLDEAVDHIAKVSTIGHPLYILEMFKLAKN